MKKGLLVVFLLAVVLFPVFAADEGLKIGDTTWKFNGEIRFMYTDQTDPMYYNGTVVKALGPFEADQINRMYQRYRFGVTGEMSDRLSAHFEFQVGDEQWGNKNYNEREVNLRTLYAYLQFRPEFLGDNTTFRVGLQGYDDIFQTSVFSDEAIGIIVNQDMDKFKANFGFLTLRDDDVDPGIVFSPDAEGLFTSASTLYLADMSYAFTDALTVKGAFYYDYLTNLPPSEAVMYQSAMAFYGIGADYLWNDSISIGGHFVLRSGTTKVIADGEEAFKGDQSGYFAYSYASYTQDKFSAKINFGYTPMNIETSSGSFDITRWGGAFALLSNDPMNIIYGFTEGDQWQTAYGLEYYGRGEVCDRLAMDGGYGGILGLMVISANLSYDFLYANFGILRATADEDTFIGLNKNYGTELDLGIKTEIMKGLEFKAVYAMFFTGDFYEYDDVTLDNGHEMSMLLRYTF